MLRVLELFAGIGACSKALERLGIEHEIVDAVEIDKYAVASFNAVHGTNFEPQDITKWDKDLQVDLIMHGSPCQDFSVAGKGAGGDEGSGTRSSLLYETLRIVEKLRPKYVIWENVKNLLSKKHVHNWNAYAERMEEMGYTNYCQVLNAKDYGVPQNRERVFTVSILGDGGFSFPPKQPLIKRLKDVLEPEVDEKYYLSDKQVDMLLAPNFGQNKRFYDPRADGLTNTITSVQKDNFVAMPDTAYCVDANYHKGTTLKGYVEKHRRQLIPDSYRIRKLTPRETWRLMGFDDVDFEKAEKVNSNTQLYKQAGNSIVVNVLEAILGRLLDGNI